MSFYLMLNRKLQIEAEEKETAGKSCPLRRTRHDLVAIKQWTVSKNPPFLLASLKLV